MARRTYSPQRSKSTSEGMPLIALFLLAIAFFVAWFASEGLLADRPHPLHWLVAGGGAFVGWLVGQAIYRLRRDDARRAIVRHHQAGLKRKP